jgi:hypothetical protein
MERGAALAEAALLFPVMVLLVMGGLGMTELVLARLRVQQAARFAAWEMTAYQVADVGGGDPRGRFRAAARRVARETAGREPLSTSGMEVEIQDGPAGGVAPEAWRLSAGGRADATARAGASSAFAPWLAAGGLALEERASVIADPWNLPDGADAVVSSTRAGDHRDGSGPAGLWLQVDRMKHHLRRLPDLRSLGLPEPDFEGPFVVSRGYRPERRSPCRWIPGYPGDAMGGLEDLGDRLDAPQPRCFDTAPFRDAQEYGASLPAQMYRMRGPYFMGCRTAGCEEEGRR